MKTLAIAALLALTACKDEPRPAVRPFDAVITQCQRSGELGCPTPIFPVADLQTALAYYRDSLGFKIDWEYGEPPDFAAVSRAGTTIFIGTVGSPSPSQLWVFARNLDKLHKEFVKRKAFIKLPPTQMPWGVREMHVIDRDGNLMRFAGRGKQ